MLKRLVAFIVIAVITGFAFPCVARADGFRMCFAESDVVLERDGKAQVSYTVQWSCRNANLHGFYFEGFSEEPVFDYANAYAVDERGTRYGLGIKRLSPRKYDVVLADGQAFHDGVITYFFRYAADLQKSGNLVLTDSRLGRLAVFNWAPVQWNDALEHETVTVHYPVAMPGSSVNSADLEKVKFLTEKYVNQRYIIDYNTVPNKQGESILSVKFHRRDITSRYHFQIQTYIDSACFDLKSIASMKPIDDAALTRAPERFMLNRLFPGSIIAQFPLDMTDIILLIVFIALLFGLFPLFIMTRKHCSMLAAQDGIARIRWTGDEWASPKLQMGTFRRAGKICKDLTALEAGILLDIPLTKLLSMMMNNMERKGMLKVKSTEPLAVERLPGAPRSSDPYENILYNAVGADGAISMDAVYEMFHSLAAGVDQKTWSCDLEATKEYYRKRIDAMLEAKLENSDEGYYWGGYRHHYHHYGAYAHRDYYERSASLDKQLAQKNPQMNNGFSQFRVSAACYEGPFLQNVCHARAIARVIPRVIPRATPRATPRAILRVMERATARVSAADIELAHKLIAHEERTEDR